MLVLWLAIIWWPNRADSAEAQNLVEDLQAEQLALVGELTSINDAMDQLDRIDSDLARFAIAVPATAELGPLLRTLDGHADDVGLQVDLFAPTNIADSATTLAREPLPPSMSSITLSLTGTGTFDAAMTFIERLEAESRLIVIDAVNLTAADDDPNQIILNVEMRVFTRDTLVEIDSTLLVDFEDES
jgi:Tfp pilus assembly protein PilO